MDKPTVAHREWYVVFCDSDEEGWWSRFCTDGFQHCFAFAQHENDVVLVEATRNCLDVRLKRNATCEELAQMWADMHGHTVLKVVAETSTRAIPWFGVFCVSTVKALLGIKGVLPLTPYGLFSLLLHKYNAVIVLPTDEESIDAFSP